MSHVLAWKLFIGTKSGLTNTLARKLGANVAHGDGKPLERCTDSYGRIVKSYGRIVKVTDPMDG